MHVTDGNFHHFTDAPDNCFASPYCRQMPLVHAVEGECETVRSSPHITCHNRHNGGSPPTTWAGEWAADIMLVGDILNPCHAECIFRKYISCICLHFLSLLNSLRARFCRGDINIYLHFMSLPRIDMTEVLKILPQVRPGPTYST